MNKGLELPVALYGILKAGAAYVPIDPAAPLSRIRLIIEDCGAPPPGHERVARAPDARSWQPASPRCRTVIGANAPAEATSCRFLPWDRSTAPMRAPPDVRVTEQDLAYIMYTSGSTGVAEGADAYACQRPELREALCPNLRRRPRRQAWQSLAAPLRHVDVRIPHGPLCGATTVIISEETTMFPGEPRRADRARAADVLVLGAARPDPAPDPSASIERRDASRCGGCCSAASRFRRSTSGG